jgi:hypothetical protein
MSDENDLDGDSASDIVGSMTALLTAGASGPGAWPALHHALATCRDVRVLFVQNRAGPVLGLLIHARGRHDSDGGAWFRVDVARGLEREPRAPPLCGASAAGFELVDLLAVDVIHRRSLIARTSGDVRKVLDVVLAGVC